MSVDELGFVGLGAELGPRDTMVATEGERPVVPNAGSSQNDAT